MKKNRDSTQWPKSSHKNHEKFSKLLKKRKKRTHMNTRIKRLKSQEWALLLSPAFPNLTNLNPYLLSKAFWLGPLTPGAQWEPCCLWKFTAPHTELGGQGVTAHILLSGLDYQQDEIDLLIINIRICIYTYVPTLTGFTISPLIAGPWAGGGDYKLPRWQNASYLWSPTEQAFLFNDNEPGWDLDMLVPFQPRG